GKGGGAGWTPLIGKGGGAGWTPLLGKGGGAGWTPLRGKEGDQDDAGRGHSKLGAGAMLAALGKHADPDVAAVDGCWSGAVPIVVDGHVVTMHLPRDGSDGCCGVGPYYGPGGSSRNVNIVVPVSEARRIAGQQRAYFEGRLRRSFPRVWDEIAGNAQMLD